MELNARLGASHYDFLMGDARYKQSFGEAGQPLVSLRLQQPRLKFRVEDTLVSLYRKIRARRASASLF
jgi:CelD/BcsL family acetyltransferase involved in cellulose biosynthesis